MRKTPASNVGKPVRAAQYLRMSTQHQRYSIENQIDAISAFAKAHDIDVVKTYADAGRSGLTLKGRPGLQRLLKDVQDGQSDYEALLVYDVSRWGRFQDPDESAAYEYRCRAAGVDVIYCSEPFENTGGAYNTLVKNLKRTIAAEFSQDLSKRVFRGQANIASKGYWVGSSPPYGYERWAVDPITGERTRLTRGQRKGVATFRTVLVPGPEEEVKLVRRIFRLFVHHRRSVQAVADTLQAEGWPTKSGVAWHHSQVRNLLQNERYIGVLTYSCSKNNIRRARGDFEAVRVEGAFEPIIDLHTFAQAQHLLTDRRPGPHEWTDEQMLDGLERLLARAGKLANKVIAADRTIPSPQSYRLRFGALDAAFTLIHYTSAGTQLPDGLRRRLVALRAQILGDVKLELRELGVDYHAVGKDMLRIGDQSVCLMIAPTGHDGAWRITAHVKPSDWLIAIRVPRTATEIIDLFVFPRRGGQRTYKLCDGGHAATIGKRVRSPAAAAQVLASCLAASSQRENGRRAPPPEQSTEPRCFM